MHAKKVAFLLLIMSMIVTLLSACNIPSAPSAATPTVSPTETQPAAPEQPTATPAAQPTDTTAPEQPTQAPAATATTVPTEPPAGDSPAPVITLGNLSNLSEYVFGLPEWPQQMIFPGPEAPLSEHRTPYPDLLLQAGANLHPVLLDPPGLGYPIPLPLNGTQPLAFAPDGSSVVVKDPSRTALFRLDGALIRELPQPANSYSASYSPDGSNLLVTSQDAFAATLYDLTAGPDSPPVATLTGFETAAPVYTASLTPGAKYVAWQARATLELQSVATGEFVARLNYTDFIESVAFAPDGSRFAVAVAGVLHLYALPDATRMAEITLSDPLNSLSFSPDGSLLAAGYAGGLQIWHGVTLEPVLALPGKSASTTMLTFSPDGKFIVCLEEGNQLGIWRSR